MSKYEASQRFFALALEYMVYSRVVGEAEREDLATLFSVKMTKKGHTQNGVRFNFDFCRGSGDMDTSLGNGVLNYISTMYFKIMNFCSPSCKFSECNCGFDGFVLKGDDSYGSCPIGSVLKNTYADFGFEAKLIIRTDPLLTEFCSGHFVPLTDGRFYYVQKLRKLLSGLSVIINADVIKNGWTAHYLRSLGDMYSVLYGQLPVYGDIAEFLKTASMKLRINTNLVQESYGASEAFANFKRSVEKIDVCTQTTLNIALANDMTFAELQAITTTLRTSKIELPPEHRRRCNLRSRRADAFVTVTEDILTGFDKRQLTIKQKLWRRLLLQTDRKPINALGQIHRLS